MALLKFKTPEGWKVLYGAILRKVLRRDRNLEDLDDKARAREVLGLTGNVTTHYHDQYIDASNAETKLKNVFAKYVKKAGDTLTGALNFANNVWNKMGDDANIGDRNVSGHVCIQGQNAETGIALFQRGSETNRGTLNYDGSKFKFDKPVNINGATNITGATTISGTAKVNGNFTATGSSTISGNEVVNGTFKTVGGFTPDSVNTNQLNNYNKINFIWGGHTNASGNAANGIIGNGNDYGGIVFGSPAGSGFTGGMTQIITDHGGGSPLWYRSRDGLGEAWGAWKQIATTADVSSAVSKATSITAQSLSTNGYIKFSNGLMIQWGRVNITVANYAEQEFSFNTDFSSTPYNLIVSQAGAVYRDSSNNIYGYIVNNKKFRIYAETGERTRPLNWVAIGK